MYWQLSFCAHASVRDVLAVVLLSLMTLLCSAKRGSLSTRVDRCLNPTKENPVQLNILNEVAALQRLTVGQLRQRFAELFGEATPASNRTWLVKRIAWRLQAIAEGDLSERARQRAAQLANDADLRLSPPKPPTSFGSEAALAAANGIDGPGTAPAGGDRSGGTPMVKQNVFALRFIVRFLDVQRPRV
jgi:hypothetical protein